MPIRVKHTVAVQTARDTDFKKGMWTPDPPLEEVIIDTFEKQANGNFSLLEATTEFIPFGDVDAVRGMFLEADAACKVYLNGSLDAIELTPNPGETPQPVKFFLEANISEVKVENTSADAVLNGVYVFWGDPTTP